MLERILQVKGLVPTVNDVLCKIEKDQALRERKQAAPLISIIERSSGNMDGDFLHSELLVDALVRMNSYPSDKYELIKICQQQYEGNPAQLKFINEFEQDYTSDRALWW